MPTNEGKVVLITGASGGIGEEVARALAKPGIKLVLAARRADRLESLAADVRRAGAEALALPVDLSDPTAGPPLVDRAVTEFGGLDVLINNAGFGLALSFAACDPAALRRQIDVNLTAPLLLTHRAIPHLVARRGVIINVGSSITSIDVPFLGAYGATKDALRYWNNALRRELWRTGVWVCLVEPGPITTGFHAALSQTGTLPKVLEPPPMITGKASEAARRIARLVDKPQRRISPLRRAVWPFRIIGGFLDAVPVLGDRVVSAILRRGEP